MMIKTLNPCSSTSKTDEILSRYRPIAPRPELPIDPSAYRRSTWAHLQARTTRTRRRTRTSISPANLKRGRTLLVGLSTASPAKTLSLHGFSHGLPQLSVPVTVPGPSPLNGSLESPLAAAPNLVTLPLIPCLPGEGEKAIDLNTVTRVPEEKDLLKQLQGSTTTRVIAPQPVRPIGSTIKVGCINMGTVLGLHPVQEDVKRPEEVEEEVESEPLPAVVSDSNNKVRLANSAYKEMVGQPECPWLDSMEPRLRCKRISGEIMLHLLDPWVPGSTLNGFSCWVRIEWGSNEKKSSVNAFCDVMRLSCESKDYVFTWRFHTRKASTPFPAV